MQSFPINIYNAAQRSTGVHGYAKMVDAGDSVVALPANWENDNVPFGKVEAYTEVNLINESGNNLINESGNNLTGTFLTYVDMPVTYYEVVNLVDENGNNLVDETGNNLVANIIKTPHHESRYE